MFYACLAQGGQHIRGMDKDELQPLKNSDGVGLDALNILDAFHLPADAGPYAEALVRILRRIPSGWGRWIDCGPGWYRLLSELEDSISKIAPEYEVHQVKEKYGTLRFYWQLPVDELECCTTFKKLDPRPVNGAVSGALVPQTRTAAEQELLESWWVRMSAHLESAEHKACRDQQETNAVTMGVSGVVGQIDALVDAAEEKSGQTCERCGSSGSLHENHGWLTTLCPVCAAEHDYTPVE
jgi:hypothetical protein